MDRYISNLIFLMESIKKKIIAIGGGGFTHSTDKILDEFIIKQKNKKKIKLGFLPTASKDSPSKIETFYKGLGNYNLELSHFELCSSIDGFSDWTKDKDIIYVGGGNTYFMLKLWWENKLYKVFKDAYNAGIILSGVSAGAVCWFEWILSDSLGKDYKPLKGMNIISGSCTPHASETNRMSKFEANINNKIIPPGIAIDDGVAVLFIDGKPNSVCSSRKNRNAYFVNKNNRIILNDHIKKTNE